MKHAVTSIRPFIGAKDFAVSKQFYKQLGFEELPITNDMSYFKTDSFGFYLQDYYVKDWINNTMLFLEVDNTQRYWDALHAMKLPETFKGVKLSKIQILNWGTEFFLHDPSGVLWHIGTFN